MHGYVLTVAPREQPRSSHAQRPPPPTGRAGIACGRARPRGLWFDHGAARDVECRPSARQGTLSWERGSGAGDRQPAGSAVSRRGRGRPCPRRHRGRRGRPHRRSRARPLTWAGLPDHALHVGVSRDGGLGALMLSAPEVGLVASAGSRRPSGGVVHHVAGHWTEFPDDAEIPLRQVRDAVKEFLRSGGCVPSCVAWKPVDVAAGDVEDDQDLWSSPGGQETPNVEPSP